MIADQNFEAFLHEWTTKRIWPMGDLLDVGDRQYIVERRATELMQAAEEKGFADSLTKTVTGYGGMTAYVNHLLWEAEFKDARPRS